MSYIQPKCRGIAKVGEKPINFISIHNSTGHPTKN